MKSNGRQRRTAIILGVFIASLFWFAFQETRRIAAAELKFGSEFKTPIQNQILDEQANIKSGAILLEASGASVNGTAVTPGATVTNASKVSTSLSSALISLGDAGRLSLDPQSELMIVHLQEEVKLTLLRGDVRFVSSDKDVLLQIGSGQENYKVACPKGGQLYLSSDEHMPAISAERALNSISITLPDGRSEMLSVGQTAKLDSNGSIKYSTSTSDKSSFDAQDAQFMQQSTIAGLLYGSTRSSTSSNSSSIDPSGRPPCTIGSKPADCDKISKIGKP